MSKQIVSGSESRSLAVKALAEVAAVVAETVGPAGRPVLLSRSISATTNAVFYTKDGISMLKELGYTDPVKDAVHKLCIQATSDTMIESGDGTTSTLIMASAFAEQLLNIDRMNPQQAIREFRVEVENAIEKISSEAVVGEAAERNVCLTSSNGDEEMTNAIMEALSQTSAYGTVVVEKSLISKKRYQIDKEYGYQAGSGYAYNISFGISVSEVAVTNGDFYLENAYVVPYNGNISQFVQVEELVKQAIQDSANTGEFVNVVFIAYDVSEEVVSNLLMINRKSPGAKFFVAKTTPTAEINGAWHQLNDIAAFSGSVIFDAGTGSRMNLIKDAGKVGKVRVGPYKTFISGRGKNNWIIQRAEQNEISIKQATTPLDREIISSRNASLTGGLVRLTIGNGLPSEIEEMAGRADDAIRSVQQCRISGALPGCGVSYIRAGELAGVSKELSNAFQSVHFHIMNNYGHKFAPKTDKGCTCYIGENGLEWGDFVKLGVADSFGTVKSVLRNGFALGSLIANLGGFCLDADIEEIQKSKQMRDILLS